MRQYKNHPVYGIGFPGPGKQWYCRGVIFDPDDKVTEIKRLECPELAFATKGEAEEHGLKLCKKWIDEQSVAIPSSSAAAPAPLKAGDPAI